MNEQDLYKEYYDTMDKLGELSNVIMNHLFPFIKKALEKGDVEFATKLAIRCPDVVTRAYAFDAINEYKKEVLNESR